MNVLNRACVANTSINQRQNSSVQLLTKHLCGYTLGTQVQYGSNSIELSCSRPFYCRRFQVSVTSLFVSGADLLLSSHNESM